MESSSRPRSTVPQERLIQISDHLAPSRNMSDNRMSLDFIIDRNVTDQGSSTDGSDNECPAQRQARHQYDDEQNAYILYLYYFFMKGGVDHDANWDAVERMFQQRFPPDTPRRHPGRGLSQTYERRQINGLNSKFYRLRDLYLPPGADLEARKRRVADLVRPYGFPPINQLIEKAQTNSMDIRPDVLHL
ncbi:hypothetical protein EJ05DRAFT_38876 [Pseudovirgaria hyperparasitica]|uniref:Uncharacterized protein n=1 Tax=Pseudovirgaria hyperparasitica TaxID=470096 RepID=A0A6A6WMK6_9PEZI|nr:uncharacterized protein EJ05DRAFT_38876 [Pseudovirgaria hyperparasitica]KAF2763450.1 hypothetical protein EJ05DRAFT_38876 [Pseudovirgaria hyperparasitica]